MGDKRVRTALFALGFVMVITACASSSSTAGTGGTAAPPGSNGAGNTTAAGGPSANDAVLTSPAQDGVQHLPFKYGPIKIQPGQNNITISSLQVPKPAVDGYIVGIHPNLVRDDGSIPAVDVIHLHHGVWLKVGLGGGKKRSAEGATTTVAPPAATATGASDDDSDASVQQATLAAQSLVEDDAPTTTAPAAPAPGSLTIPANGAEASSRGSSYGQIFFASGEEKTQMILPAGYGYPYKAKDIWVINYMLHNLLSTPDSVSIVYDLDFIPADSPAAKNIKTARPIWNDVESGKLYPVFDVIKGSGKNGLYTYPDDAVDPYKGRGQINEWTVDKDSVLLGTAGHLHPGGLYTDMFVTRAGAGATATADAKQSIVGDKAHVFRSDAVYYEPAGAVSWDVSMTATPLDWFVSVKKGDTISINATYDTKRASWYESMGIMVLWIADAADAPATTHDPFQQKVDVKGEVTHGHLAENDNHGGGVGKFADMTKLPNGPTDGTVTIADFTYAPGDMSGIYSDVPTVKPGQPLTFINKDAPIQPAGVWHTITACANPCNESTGVAYPLADSDIQFDSGQLGNAGPPTAGRVDWTIPQNLPAGTYSYFCRIHPSMRGAFRVDPNAAAPTAGTAAPTTAAK